MTFVEMVLCMFLLSMLAMASWPLAENANRRGRELELRERLREIRVAIDRYYDRQEKAEPSPAEPLRYPATLQELVGLRLLRRVPEDPMTGQADWVLIPFREHSRVFDVRSRSGDAPPSGEPYAAW
jgi:general secretion pathway protein G